MDNHRWVFTNIKTLELQTARKNETCGPYEAVVRPQSTGLCGSDMHIYNTGLIRGLPFKKPFVLGHETSAIVDQVGEKVTSIAVGDRVALEPGEGCLRCSHCKAGFYAHCDDMKFAAALGRDGTLQTFYTLPADLCYKLPNIEPLAVAVHAVSSVACMKPNSNIAVFGAGPVGLLTVAVAKALGARKVLAIDVNSARLDFARSYSGAETYIAELSKADDHAEALARDITEKHELSGREGVDLVIECSGAESCVQTGILLLKKRGMFVQVGNSKPYANVPLLSVINKELFIKGSFRYGPGDFEMAIDLVSRGLIDLKSLITHKYKWEEAVQAYQTTTAAKSPDGKMAIKVLIAGPEM